MVLIILVNLNFFHENNRCLVWDASNYIYETFNLPYVLDRRL